MAAFEKYRNATPEPEPEVFVPETDFEKTLYRNSPEAFERHKRDEAKKGAETEAILQPMREQWKRRAKQGRVAFRAAQEGESAQPIDLDSIE